MTARTYPVPAKLQTPLLGAAPTMSDIDLFVEAGYGSTDERAWALNVRSRFVTQQLDRICGSVGHLPTGIVSTEGDVDVVVALGFNEELIWNGQWGPLPPKFDDAFPLTDEEVAFTIDALEHGSAGLALRADYPVAFIREGVTAAAGAAPAEAKYIAVVDPQDRAAVLELLALLPGPVIMRRHDGKWQRDNHWLQALRSVKPPPVVTLDEGMMASVATQVDAATKGKPFEAATASGFDPRLHEMQVEWMLLSAMEPLVAFMPPKLQKYWLVGPGAAKIRWGTPGAWRRCHRQLSKYFDPIRAKGACTNLGQKLGGRGVAWDVG